MPFTCTWRYGNFDLFLNCQQWKINKLIDQSQATSLSIHQNSAELASIYKDLRNDEILLKDVNLKNDLINIFDSLHQTYLNSMERLSDYQISHSALLLEFEVAVQIDLQKIYNCILNQQFYKHGALRIVSWLQETTLW